MKLHGIEVPSEVLVKVISGTKIEAIKILRAHDPRLSDLKTAKEFVDELERRIGQNKMIAALELFTDAMREYAKSVDRAIIEMRAFKEAYENAKAAEEEKEGS